MKIYKTQKQVEKDIKKGELTMPTGKKIEKPQIEIRCLECGKGKPLIISGDLEWKINLIGDWEFIHECGNKITLPKDYLEESK